MHHWNSWINAFSHVLLNVPVIWTLYHFYWYLFVPWRSRKWLEIALKWDTSLGFFRNRSVRNPNGLYLAWKLGGDLPWGRLSHNFLFTFCTFPEAHRLACCQQKHPGVLDKWSEHSWEFVCSSGVSCHWPAFSKQKFAQDVHVLGMYRLPSRNDNAG